MGVGIFNVVMGIVCIIGGLSGEVALLGTHSSTALVVVGVGIAGLGVYQIIRSQRGR